MARIEKALPKERAFGIRCNSEEKDLSAAACDGGDYQHLVPILEAVFLIAEEADILAAVLAISRTLLVCFWNAFGNRTLTDMTFSFQA